METKHTKGNWEAHKYAGRDYCVYSEDNNRDIAIARGEHSEETEANARLIAAAPEMLGQLMELREWYEKNRSKYFGEETPIIFSKVLSTIQKATSGL